MMLVMLLVAGCSRSLPLLQADMPTPPPDLIIAAVVSEPAAETASGTSFFTHQVRWPGETLVTMARWYTGTPVNWRTIAKVNPDLDPRRLHIGDKILIPGKLVKTRRPLPNTVIPVSPNTPSAGAPEIITDSGAATLFGPIDDQPQTTVPAEDTPLPPLETID